MTDDADEAPGWDAIDEALARVHGKLEPFHAAPPLHFAAGGEDPIDGISFYPVSKPPHWHVVTYGFSELYGKESDDPETSGFGFELTLRVARKKSDKEPPSWAFNFLQNLARYVFRSGNAFGPGHHMNLNGPIALGRETAIVAIAFALDPQLGEIDTPHGRLSFLQVVGTTKDEHEALLDWDTDAFVELLRERDPLLVTDLDRASVLADATLSKKIAERTRKEGASMGACFIGHLKAKKSKKGVVVEVGANGVSSFRRGLTGRIPFDRDMLVAGPEAQLELAPGKQAKAVEKKGVLRLELPRDVALELARVVLPKRGTYRCEGWPELEVVVVPSEIKGPDGKVVEVIG